MNTNNKGQLRHDFVRSAIIMLTFLQLVFNWECVFFIISLYKSMQYSSSFSIFKHTKGHHTLGNFIARNSFNNNVATVYVSNVVLLRNVSENRQCILLPATCFQV